MRKVAAVLWALVPPVLLSALLHAAGRDVGGVKGLAKPEILVSVILWSFPVAVVALLCLGSLVRGGLPPFALVAGLCAAALGAIITAAGSTATTPGGKAVSFLGATALVLLTFAASVFPGAAIMRARRTEDFAPLLREAIGELRLAGAFAPALELEATLDGAYTSSSEMLGDIGLAILRARRDVRGKVPWRTRHKLARCLREIRKTWPGLRLA